MPFPTPSWFVPAVGAAEVGIGLWFLSGYVLLYATPVFAAPMAGTPAVLVILPEQAFRHGHVWELTMTGDFAVKNLVLPATRWRDGRCAQRPSARRDVGRS